MPGPSFNQHGAFKFIVVLVFKMFGKSKYLLGYKLKVAECFPVNLRWFSNEQVYLSVLTL